jgi:DNA-binding transcriptional LysR family regulator
MLKLSLDAIEIIDAIDRGGSFAAAAEALHKVPSTISYTVSKLEEQLGFPLFARRGPRVSLTPAGSELLNEGRWLLRSAADLESRLRRIATGYEAELRLVHDSLLPAAALVEHIRAFEALNCGTRLRLGIEVMTGAWEALREGRAEIWPWRSATRRPVSRSTPPACARSTSRSASRPRMRWRASIVRSTRTTCSRIPPSSSPTARACCRRAASAWSPAARASPWPTSKPRSPCKSPASVTASCRAAASRRRSRSASWWRSTSSSAPRRTAVAGLVRR